MSKYKKLGEFAKISGAMLLSGIAQVVEANDPASPISSTITPGDGHTLVSGPSSHVYTITSDSTHTVSNTNSVPIHINNQYTGDLNPGSYTISTNSFFHLNTLSVAAGDTANFHSTLVTNTNDIVWIDNQANIWGKISADNHANLYMFDPHGINLYNGSSVDVAGSFYISNASNVHLGYYSGTNNSNQTTDGCFGICTNVLTASNPVSFGFLGNETGNLTVHGATMNQFAEDIQIALIGTGIDLVDSTIAIKGGGIQGYALDLNNVRVPYSDGLDIRILSLAQNDKLDVPINITNWHEADPALSNIQFNGVVNISNTLLNAGGDGEETIVIKGGDVTINHSTLISTNWGTDNVSNEESSQNENQGNITSDFYDENSLSEPDVPVNYNSIDILATHKLDITASQLLAWSTYGQAGSIKLVAPAININASTIDTRSALINWYDQNNNLNDNIARINNIGPGQAFPFDPSTGYFSLATPFFIHGIDFPAVSSFQSNSNVTKTGDINITAGNSLTIGNNSVINSSSYVNANGGDINIYAGNFVWLANSQITTSVNVTNPGLTGGNINLGANYLVMDGGFIQANSLSRGGGGGLVNINAPYIIPSGGYVLVGGSVAQTFRPYSGMNVIQAAAPDGVNGVINITSPQLNLSGTLANLVIPNFDQVVFTQDMCAIGEGSSLTQTGRGALPRRADDKLLWTPSSQF